MLLNRMKSPLMGSANCMNMVQCLLLIIMPFLCGVITQVHAGENRQLGLRAGAYTESDDFFLGGEYLQRIDERVYFNPNVEYLFVENGTFLSLNLDGHYDFPTEGNFYAWAGGGAGLLVIDPPGISENEATIGLNLIAGIGLKTSGSSVPYVQGKAVLSENTLFSLALGWRF